MNSCMTNYDATGSGKTCFSFTLNLFINAKGPLEPNFEKYLHSKISKKFLHIPNVPIHITKNRTNSD